MTDYSHLIQRPRRLRHHPAVRGMVRETSLSLDHLIYPLFIKEGLTAPNPIASMPGLSQLPLEGVADEAAEVYALGIPAVMLFGIPKHKDAMGSSSCRDDSIVAQSIRRIKDRCPDLLVTVDVCVCEYTDTGHCGIMNTKTGRMDLDNDATLDVLAEQSLSLVRAGADMLFPSGMVDGQVGTIREALDAHGFAHIPIFSHSSKYASACYGPFRDIAEGKPQFGDRKSYQLDISNIQAAMHEHELDLAEGADFIMVKPAGWYLDVIYATKQRFPERPLGAYQVSGEFAMIKAAIQNGWLDEKKIIEESLLAIRRAGADVIITYFAKEYAMMKKMG